MIDKIINQQKKWAEDCGIKLRDTEHTASVYDNLYEKCLNRKFKEDITQGNGGEFRDHINGRPAKMSSLRSSSALCVNVFAPQVEKNSRRLPSVSIASLVGGSVDHYEGYELFFEDKHPTGVGSHANLDVALKSKDGIIDYFIESKFLEPYDHTSTDTPNLLKQSYLDITDPAQPTIKRRFIEQLPQKVVEELSTWPKTTYKNQGKKYTGIICPNYKTVDVAQLLKHIFGLMNTYNDPRKFMLLYLYYKQIIGKKMN